MWIPLIICDIRMQKYTEIHIRNRKMNWISIRERDLMWDQTEAEQMCLSYFNFISDNFWLFKLVATVGIARKVKNGRFKLTVR